MEIRCILPSLPTTYFPSHLFELPVGHLSSADHSDELSDPKNLSNQDLRSVEIEAMPDSDAEGSPHAIHSIANALRRVNRNKRKSSFSCDNSEAVNNVMSNASTTEYGEDDFAKFLEDFPIDRASAIFPSRAEMDKYLDDLSWERMHKDYGWGTIMGEKLVNYYMVRDDIVKANIKKKQMLRLGVIGEHYFPYVNATGSAKINEKAALDYFKQHATFIE